jgi:exopolyphosphatase/guanosine-5'-triphosphate,3'-diphosphate pyrophosphatase
VTDQQGQERGERGAALDIGSNTVHLLVAAWRDGRIEPLDDASELVGLARGVYAGKMIAPESLDRAVAAVEKLVERARSKDAKVVRLVATAAVRDATNKDDLIAAVRRRTGLDLEIIDGEREAALSYQGASAGEDGGAQQVCDVGGGSTEVIRAEHGHIILQTSLPLGSSRLADLYHADPPAADELARVDDAATRALTGLPEWRPARLIVTGGTATTLAHVAGARERRYVMSTKELSSQRELFARETAGAIAHSYGVEGARARLLPAGAAIIAALCAATGAADVVLTGAGLRDGLLIEYFTKDTETHG